MSRPDPWASLPLQIENTLKDAQGIFSVYIRDIDSGRSVEVDADELYNAWSLLKVPVVVTLLRRVEAGEQSLDQRVRLAEDGTGPVCLPVSDEDGGDDTFSLRQLIEHTLRYSDNRASFALATFFSPSEFRRTLTLLGIEPPGPEEPATALPLVSARMMGGMFRCLYESCCLRPDHSQLVLDGLTGTLYDEPIRRGLGEEIPLAHKVGFHAETGEFHDCGLIILNETPFLFCVMSRDTSRAEAERVMGALAFILREMQGEPDFLTGR